MRLNGDWEGWLGFFLDGVAETAQQAVDTAQRLLALLARDRARIAALGQRAGNVGLVFEQFARRVVLAVPQVAPALSLSAPTIRAAVRTLQELEIVNELTGQQRHRILPITPISTSSAKERSRCERCVCARLLPTMQRHPAYFRYCRGDVAGDLPDTPSPSFSK